MWIEKLRESLVPFFQYPPGKKKRKSNEIDHKMFRGKIKFRMIRITPYLWTSWKKL